MDMNKNKKTTTKILENIKKLPQKMNTPKQPKKVWWLLNITKSKQKPQKPDKMPHASLVNWKFKIENYKAYWGIPRAT